MKLRFDDRRLIIILLKGGTRVHPTDNFTRTFWGGIYKKTAAALAQQSIWVNIFSPGAKHWLNANPSCQVQ